MSASAPISAPERSSLCSDDQRGLQDRGAERRADHGVRGALSRHARRRSLGLEDRIGSLQVGREADIVVLDPRATPLLSIREARSLSLEETLFVLMTLGDDRAVRATYVAGALAHARDPVDA